MLCILQARCFEEENESLKCQIVDAEKKLKGRRASARVSSAVAEADYGLDAVVERLRRERVGSCCCCCCCWVRQLCRMFVRVTPLKGFLSLRRRSIAFFTPSHQFDFSLYCDKDMAHSLYPSLSSLHPLQPPVLQDETLCDTEDLRKELERLMEEYEKAAQQKILLQQGRQDVAEVPVVNTFSVRTWKKAD